MNRVIILLALMSTTCGTGGRKSPFVNGAPPPAILEHFRTACQVRREPTAPAGYSTVGSFTSERDTITDTSGRRCDVALSWRDNEIVWLRVLVNNNGPFFDEFVRKAVLPLLKDRTAIVVREELLDHLEDGPREKKFISVPGGGSVETELRLWNGGERGPSLTAEILITRR